MKPYRIVLLLAVLGLLSPLVTDLQAQQPTPEGTTATVPTISTRTATIHGQEVGEVLVGDQVVLRIREAAGGYTPTQRANIVATRLSTFVTQGYGWEDVTIGRMNNETVLLMNGNLLVTVDGRHAAISGMTPTQLAYTWQGQTQTALRGGPVAVVAGATEEWPDWTRATTRIVPILAVGTPGVRLGLAQITGPDTRVEQVDAVLQLDLVFQRAARIRAFVPSTSITELNRVQGVAVSALLQYRLFEF